MRYRFGDLDRSRRSMMSPSSTPQTTAHQQRIRDEFTRQADTMAAAVFTDQEILDRIRQAAALTALQN
jgi:hypothetical protein